MDKGVEKLKLTSVLISPSSFPLQAVPTPSPTENIRLQDFDGPYQLSEYLSRLVAQEGGGSKNVDQLVRIPGEGEAEGSSTEEWVDPDVVSRNPSLQLETTQ